MKFPSSNHTYVKCGLLMYETEVESLVVVLLQNKNNGEGCDCVNGSFGMERSACFWAFNG